MFLRGCCGVFKTTAFRIKTAQTVTSTRASWTKIFKTALTKEERALKTATLRTKMSQRTLALIPQPYLLSLIDCRGSQLTSTTQRARKTVRLRICQLPFLLTRATSTAAPCSLDRWTRDIPRLTRTTIKTRMGPTSQATMASSTLRAGSRTVRKRSEMSTKKT